MEIITKSAGETKNFGKQFANNLKGGETIALVGDLGSGKTTFVQGLAEGLGVEAKVISPTFILMREHKIGNRKQEAAHRNLYHIDLYRLEEDLGQELRNLGITQIWNKPENIVVIEWADKAREFMPEGAKWIKFDSLEDGQKRIYVNLAS